MQVCGEEDLAFLIVDLFQFRCQPPSSGGFACLGTPFSSLARYTGATIEAKVMLPKLAFQAVLVILSHDPFDLRSLQQRWMSKNYNFEAAASYPKYRLFREQKWSCKGVGGHLLSNCNPALCCVMEDLAFLDISRPVRFVSSSMPATKQWWFCLSWKPPWSC